MPRNSNGVYTLPESAFVPGTVISSAAVNSNNSDIADALTDSLSRTGEGAMLAALQLDATGFFYANDTDTGMYRSGTNEQTIKCGNVDVVDFSSTAVSFLVPIQFNGAELIPPGFGPVPWTGVAAPSGWLLCYGQAISRTTYSRMFANIGTNYGGGDGSTTFNVPDMRGTIPGGKDNMGGVAAGNLTATTITPNGTTLNGFGGTQTVTLNSTQIPAITPTGSVSAPSITVNDNKFATFTATGGPSPIVVANGGGSIGITASADAPVFTGNSFGGGLAHNNVQPTRIFNYIIYAGV